MPNQIINVYFTHLFNQDDWCLCNSLSLMHDTSCCRAEPSQAKTKLRYEVVWGPNWGLVGPQGPMSSNMMEYYQLVRRLLIWFSLVGGFSRWCGSYIMIWVIFIFIFYKINIDWVGRNIKVLLYFLSLVAGLCIWWPSNWKKITKRKKRQN